jgi:hypothetical protein
MFETQNPDRKAQNMSALLALIILLGIVLPIPIGAGFADWMNATNAPATPSDRFIEVNTFDLTGSTLYNETGYRPYFNWYNCSDDTELEKHYVELTAGILTANDGSTEGEGYDNTDKDKMDDWDSGYPWWEVYFNYTAKEAYTDGVIKLVLNMDSDSEYNETLSYAGGGKGLLSEPELGEDKEVVTVTLSAGGVVFYAETLATDGKGIVEAEVLIDVDDLRMAIMNAGEMSHFKLKVVGHDIRPIDMADSEFQSYNVGKTFARDDGLYLAAVISTICAAIGIFLVQPKYSLPIGSSKSRKRGY